MGAFCVCAAVVAQVPANVWHGVYSDAQAQHGQEVYQRSCQQCHGPELAGADMTPALVGGTFTSNWDGLTVGDLYDRIRTTMPADRPGTLSRQDITDVIAFMLKRNGWPSGPSPMAAEPLALKQIAVSALKPER